MKSRNKDTNTRRATDNSVGAALTLGLLATACVQPSWAQEQSADVLEEIVVTAQKREESLQDTPISVTAFSEQTLLNRDTTNLAGLAASTPNLEINFGKGDGGSTNAAVFIRGVGQNDFIFPTDPGVGLYVDGVYVARSIGALMDLSDIERVEVLRGPQGTLYGKNTIGGAINVISGQPSYDFNGLARVTGGSRGRLDVDARVNIPLVQDTMAVQIAVASRNQDGYVDRADGLDLGDTNVDVGRVSLLWDVSPDVSINFSIDASSVRQNGAPGRLGDTFSFPGGLYDLYNGVAAPYVQVRDGLPSGAVFNDAWVSSDPFVSNGTGPSGDEADTWGGNLTTSWEISNDLQLRSITGYREMEADIQVDMDQSPFPIVHTDEQQSQSQFSEELQLSGGSEESRWNWLAGLYYFRENADDRNQTLLASGLYDALGLLPAALIPLVPSVTCPSGSPADPCAGGAGNPFNALLDLDVSPITSLTTDNWAAFGQATFQATDTFSITIGGRYSWERKEYFIDSVYPNSGRVASPPTTDEQTWTNFTPRIGVEYDVSDDVMAYASYSQGFKSGGWNPRPLTPEEFRGYDPETLNAYEVGFKSRLFDGRMTLNMAAFYSQYEDVQLQTNSISPTTGGLLLTVDNAGSVDIYGAELEIQARPVRGLDLNLGVGYIENEYQSLAPGVGYSIDNQLPKTPAWSINFGAQYTFDLPDNYGELRIRADANHRSETFHDPANSPSIVQPGYTLVDARFAWSSPGDDYELAIFGKNLTDELYHTTAEFVPSFGFRNEVLGEPREWGVSLTRRF